ncbi:MAG: 50S ribosomal protein L21 [Nevskiales bacterium]
MHAVIQTGGKQYRVAAGDVVRVELLEAEAGGKVTFDEVLLLSDGNTIKVGQPFVKGAKVTAEVVRNGRGDKITIIKLRRRKNYRRKAGHRQEFTELKITDIKV